MFSACAAFGLIGVALAATDLSHPLSGQVFSRGIDDIGRNFAPCKILKGARGGGGPPGREDGPSAIDPGRVGAQQVAPDGADIAQALQCQLRLYGVATTTTFVFNEVHRVKAVLVDFASQPDLDLLRPWLKRLLDGFAAQFGSPLRPERPKPPLTWRFVQPFAAAEVTLDKRASRWAVSVVFTSLVPVIRDTLQPPRMQQVRPKSGF